MNPAGKVKRKSVLRWLPGVIISAIAIYAIFKFVQIEDMESAFARVSWQFVAIIFCLDVISLWIRGAAWRAILGNKISLVRSFFGVSEGYFLNNIFPLRAGEIGRSLFVGQSSGLGTFHVLSTIVIERAFDIVYAAILILVTLPLVVGLSWVKTIALVLLAVVIAALVCLFLAARNRQKVSAWTEKIGGRSKFISRYITPQVSKFMDGLSALTNPKQFLISFFWIGMTWAIWVLIYDVMIWQVVPDAPLWSGAFIGSLLSLGVAIPSAPAAIGVYEATMVAGVVIMGGDESAALVVALIMHVLQFLSSGIFGLWGLVREGQSLTSVFARLQNQTDLVSTAEAEPMEAK